MLNEQEFEDLKQAFNQLTDSQKKQFLAEIIPSSKTSDDSPKIITGCPSCSATEFIRNGKAKNGTQRYRCKECKAHFVEKTGTVFSKTRKSINTIKKYIQCMLQKRTLRECASICHISLATSFVWRHKICDVLRKKLENIELEDEIQADETYFKISYKGNRKINANQTLPKKKKRGLSKEKVCVAVAISKDRKNASVAGVAGLGRPSLSQLEAVFKGKIKPGTTLVTDALNCYPTLSQNMQLHHIPIPSTLRKLNGYNINKVNSYHSHLKRLVNRHFLGVATKYLNNYLAYFNFLVFMKDVANNKSKILLNYLFDTPYRVTAAELYKR